MITANLEKWNYLTDPELPLRARKARVYWLEDLFSPAIADSVLKQVWLLMQAAHKLRGHEFRILTEHINQIAKRLGPNGINWYAVEGKVPCPEPGIWIGVKVTDQNSLEVQVPLLLDTVPTEGRFLHCVPDSDIDLSFVFGKACLVCGGSGSHCDPCSWTGYEVEPYGWDGEDEPVHIDHIYLEGSSTCSDRVARQCADARLPASLMKL